MMGFFIQHKIVVVIIGLAIAVFAWFALSQDPAGDALLTSDVVVNDGPDQDLVATLLALRAVELEGAIFSNSAFVSLKDFSTQIVPEPIGRPNPFAPLGAGAVPTSSTTRGAQIFNPGSAQ